MTEDFRSACIAHGIDVQGTLGRLDGMDALYERMLSRFAADGTAAQLASCTQPDEAFRLAHSLKGMAANLGFTKLSELSGQACTLFREGHSDEAMALKDGLVAEAQRLATFLKERT